MKIEWAGSLRAVTKRDTPVPIHRHRRTLRTLLMRDLSIGGATLTLYGQNLRTQLDETQGIREFDKAFRFRGKVVQVIHMDAVCEVGFDELCALFG
jgi:hypothetical protein